MTTPDHKDTHDSILREDSGFVDGNSPRRDSPQMMSNASRSGSAVTLTGGLKIADGQGGWAYSAGAAMNIDANSQNAEPVRVTLTAADNGTIKDAGTHGHAARGKSSGTSVGAVEFFADGDAGDQSSDASSDSPVVFRGHNPSPTQTPIGCGESQRENIPPKAKCKPQREEDFEVKVSKMNGRYFNCRVRGSDPVESLMEKVKDREGTPPEDQRMTCGKKNLVKGRTLRECGVTQNTSNVLITENYRGG